MAQVIEYPDIVKRIIREYGAVHPSVEDIRVETVCDDAQGHYELVYSGWARGARVHGPVLHLDVHDGKVWVEHDGTSPRHRRRFAGGGDPRGEHRAGVPVAQHAAPHGVRDRLSSPSARRCLAGSAQARSPQAWRAQRNP
jgi:hypothetical protein